MASAIPVTNKGPHRNDVPNGRIGWFYLRIFLIVTALCVSDELAARSLFPADSLRSLPLSPASRRVAQLLELTALLDRWNQLTPDDPERERLRNRVMERITVTHLAISSSASTMDYLEEQADAAASRLEEIDNRREQRWTIAAVSIGAVGDLVAGWIFARSPNSSALDGVGIISGVLGTALGVRLLLLKPRRISFPIRQDPLLALKTGRDSVDTFTAPVWRYLNMPNQELTNGQSPRQQLLADWQAETDTKKNPTRARQAKSGLYTANQLRQRADQLDQLEATINQFKRQLLTLADELTALP